MSSKVFFIFLFLCGLMISSTARAQDFQQLRKVILQQQAKTRQKIHGIEGIINSYQNRLQTASQKYDAIYKQYTKLRRQIALHKKKITSLEKKQHEIHKEINITNEKIKKQQQQLQKLIKNYKKTLRYVYENGRTSRLALILSAASLHQMMIRDYYLKKFEVYRKGQVTDIKKTKMELKESQKQRREAAGKNKKVLAGIKHEKQKLAQKASKQEATVKLLRENKTKLKGKLAEERQHKKDMNSTLSHLIARENKIRKREKEQQAGTETNTPVSDVTKAANLASRGPAPGEKSGYVGRIGFLSDKQLDKIQAAFAKQKGKMDWPVASHTISEHFGRHRNPIYGTVTPNLGIEIVTKPRAPVHVVANGYVFAVQPITGYGNVVFVSHGKYKTAYGNLSRVMVRPNTILKKGQLVGYAGGKNTARGASLFFMLREGNRNLNPEKWLKRK